MIRKNLYLVSLLLSISSLVGATSVSGIKSINNQSESVYKTTDEDLIKLKSSLGLYDRFNEILNFDTTKENVSDNYMLSYLQEQSILGKDLELNYDGLKIKSEPSYMFDYSKAIRKSDFLVSLSKSVYGNIVSRPVVIRTSSERDGKYITLSDRIPLGYKGEDTEFDYTLGDYNLFLTNNVYEQYFQKLVGNGVISINDFSNIKFIEDFNNSGKVINGSTFIPSWSNSNSNIPSISRDTNILGSKFKIEDDSITIDKDIKYFFDEKILVIDALKFIEKILRTNEKEMTNLEAEIINYKYGASYLNFLTGEDKNTVMFLVAKGILNLEDENEFKNLYRNLDFDTMVTLLYRVSNKDGRLNFSELQLTDSDNYWLSKGYYKNDVTFNSSPIVNIPSSVKEIKQQSSVKSYLFGLIKLKNNLYFDNKDSEFIVTKTFDLSDKNITYYFNGTKIDKNLSKDANEMISKVTKNQSSVTVEFKVMSGSSQKALSMIDAYISVNKNGSFSFGKVTGISMVTKDKKKEVYVSKSSLLSLKDLPIEIINDKYLKNSKTGSKALLLEDSDIAIVGNEIIKTTDVIVYSQNNEVYYNLDIIVRLLSNAAIDELSLGTVISYSNTNNNNEDIEYSVKSSTKENAGIALVDMIKQPKPGQTLSYVDSPHLNVTNDTVTGNYLIYDMRHELGVDEVTYMVIKFSYVLPLSTDYRYSEAFNSNLENKTLTMGSIYNELYKRPSDSAGLTKWWDSNKIFNDSLLNYLMGTDNSDYMRSGFISPSIDIITSSNNIKEEDLNNFFTTKIGLPNDFINSYGKTDSGKSFIDNYFINNGSEIKTNNATYNNLKNSRTFNIIKNTVVDTENSVLDGYMHFGTKYALSKSNQIFYNISNDPSYVVETSKKSIEVEFKRVDVNNFILNNTYGFEAKEGNILNSLKLTRTSNTGLYTFSSETPITGKVKEGDDGNFYVEGKYSDGKSYPLEKLYEMYYSEYEGTNQTVLDENSGEYKTELIGLGSLINSYAGTYVPIYHETKDKDKYFINGKIYVIIKGGEGASTFKIEDLEDHKNETVQVFPRININTNYIKSDKYGLLSRKTSSPYYSIEGVVNSGIVGQIVDSLVYKSSEYTKYSEIPSGSKVHIGGVYYSKSGTLLNSDVYSSTDEISTLLGTDLKGKDSQDAIKTIVLKAIGNVSIYNKTLSDRGNTLADYITKANIGPGKEDSKYNNTLISEGPNLKVKTGSSVKDYVFGNNFTSICFSFSLDDNMMFRKIKTGEYELVPISNRGSDGYISNVPYFIESLDFVDNNGLFSTLDKQSFTKASNSDGMLAAYMEQFKKKRIEDIIGLSTYIASVALMVLGLLNLMVTILHMIGADKYLKVIYDNGQKFYYDIYAMLTFNLQSVNREMSVIKRFIITLILVTFSLIVDKI